MIPNYIVGDERKLQNILLNVISNAFRFTNKGSIKISAHCLQRKNDIVYLRFSILDTGIGIPREKQLEIYQPFYKIEPSNKGGDRGRGVGLSLVKKYVEEMNGELALNSKIGEGSEFIIIVPFKTSLDQTSSHFDN